jgi:chromosome partitioning protein
MSSHVVAVVNMKGGVGKTSTVVSLSEALAAETQAPILVIDLDAQSNASYCLAGDELLAELIETGKTIDAYFEDVLIEKKKISINEYIRRNVSDVTHAGSMLQISLLPASPQLRTVEREIIYRMTERKMSLRGIEGQVY